MKIWSNHSSWIYICHGFCFHCGKLAKITTHLLALVHSRKKGDSRFCQLITTVWTHMIKEKRFFSCCLFQPKNCMSLLIRSSCHQHKVKERDKGDKYHMWICNVFTNYPIPNISFSILLLWSFQIKDVYKNILTLKLDDINIDSKFIV